MYTKSYERLSVLILANNKHYGLNTTVAFRGSSMLPLLRDGQRLILNHKLSDEIKVGDIIIFQNNRQLVAHRVLAMRSKDGERYYMEKGDNQLNYGRVNHNDVLGKVIAIDGKNKWLSVNKRTYIVNYIFAKFSYIVAMGSNAVGVVIKAAFKGKRLSGSHLIQRICLRGSHLLIRLLLLKHDV